MLFQFHPYTVVLILSALVTLITSSIVWRRTAPGSFTLGIILLAMSIWDVTYALVWCIVPLELKIFWLKLMYLGVVAIPTLFLVFTLQITHRENWLTFRNVLLLSIEPIFILGAIWLSPDLMFAATELFVKNDIVTLHVHRGIGFLINAYYSYAIILLSFYILWSSSRNANSFFKRQYRLILYGSIVPFIFSAYTQTKFVALSDLDLAPITFGVSAIFYAYAIVRHKFMDLIPVARGRLIENMSDGVLVINEQGHIIDINPAMQNYLENEPESYLGKKVADVLNIWAENESRLVSTEETQLELKLPEEPSRYLDLRVTPLYDDDYFLTGRLIVVREVTDRKQVEKDLRFAMDRMQTQLIEIGLLQSQLREQAIRDALTNLFNRRYLEETLERELARASREVYPVCIVMMDIDHFKDVNDTYGHEAGDLVLRTLADTVTKQSRQGDFVCRYGGEEFVLVMPNIGVGVAKERALDLHKVIETMTVSYNGDSINKTVSMGLAWYPAHGETKEELLRAADKALYAAKHAGRNCVHVYSNEQDMQEE